MRRALCPGSGVAGVTSVQSFAAAAGQNEGRGRVAERRSAARCRRGVRVSCAVAGPCCGIHTRSVTEVQI